MGTPLREIVFDIGGGIPGRPPHQGRADRRPLRRLHPGRAPRHRHRLRLAAGARRHDGLRRPGRHGRAHLHGRRRQVLHGLHPRESCGKCIPCREGTTRMLEILSELTERPVGDDLRRARAVPRHPAPRGARRDHQGHEPLRPRPDRAEPGAQHAALVPRRVRGPRHRAAPARPAPARSCSSSTSTPSSAPAAPCAPRTARPGRSSASASSPTPSSSTAASAAAPAPTPAPSRPCWPSPERNDHEAHHQRQRDRGARAGETVLQAARRAGIEIPHLCSLDWAPSPAASCRLCVVEVEGAPAACSPSCTLAVDRRHGVHTHTPRVLKARRAIMELLLASHPHDCLYCVRARRLRAADARRRPRRAPGAATSAPSSSTRWTSAPRRCGATPTSASSAAAASPSATTCRASARSTSSAAGSRPRSAPGFAVGLNVSELRQLRPVRARVPDGRASSSATRSTRSSRPSPTPTPSWSRSTRRRCRPRLLEGHSKSEGVRDMLERLAAALQARRLRRRVRHGLRRRPHDHGGGAPSWSTASRTAACCRCSPAAPRPGSSSSRRTTPT